METLRDSWKDEAESSHIKNEYSVIDNSPTTSEWNPWHHHSPDLQSLGTVADLSQALVMFK